MKKLTSINVVYRQTRTDTSTDNKGHLRLLPAKINKIPEFYTMPAYIIRQRDRGQAEAKASRPRLRSRPKLRGRGQNCGLEDLTSLKCA